MSNEVIQIKANEDDCVYIYNVELKKWSKLCDIKSSADLPASVKQKLDEMRRA
jgi:hypothetical protein